MGFAAGEMLGDLIISTGRSSDKHIGKNERPYGISIFMLDVIWILKSSVSLLALKQSQRCVLEKYY
jgi:hypothetical protein